MFRPDDDVEGPEDEKDAASGREPVVAAAGTRATRVVADPGADPGGGCGCGIGSKGGDAGAAVGAAAGADPKGGGAAAGADPKGGGAAAGADPRGSVANDCVLSELCNPLVEEPI